MLGAIGQEQHQPPRASGPSTSAIISAPNRGPREVGHGTVRGDGRRVTSPAYQSGGTVRPGEAEKLRLGDIEVVRIGLGTNRLTNTPENVAFVKKAVAAGVSLIDTAYTYTGGESEQTIGAALSSPTMWSWRRKAGTRPAMGSRRCSGLRSRGAFAGCGQRAFLSTTCIASTDREPGGAGNRARRGPVSGSGVEPLPASPHVAA